VTPTNEVWLVMELLDQSLDRFVASLAGEQSQWPLADRKRVANEIALGLEYVHGVLHRDLKSPNVMLTAADRTAKLIDFGLSKDTNSAKNKSSTIQGSSSLWMAPEINCNDDFSQASDVYAFGIVLTEIVLLELPSMSTMRKVAKLTGEWKALIDMCTEEEPSDRPSTTRCVEMHEN
jgi:serine/threonine protein kinase